MTQEQIDLPHHVKALNHEVLCMTSTIVRCLRYMDLYD